MITIVSLCTYSWWATLTAVSTYHDNDNDADNASVVQKNMPLPTKQREFDYQGFWRDAWETANRSLELARRRRSGHAGSTRRGSSSPSPCPKVYVYDLPPSMTDLQYPPAVEENSVEILKNDTFLHQVFGPPAALLPGKEESNVIRGGYLHDTPQYATAAILEYRLRTSQQCLTSDPQQADLFFVPVRTAHKHSGTWKHICSTYSGADVLKPLIHLNASNACRHFFAMGKEHYAAKKCKGWMAAPLPEMRPFQRLAHSHFGFTRDTFLNESRLYRTDYNKTKTKYPNLMSMPAPSSLHFKKKANSSWTSSLPAGNNHPAANNNRPFLMLYVGAASHGDTQVRQRIRDDCQRYQQEQQEEDHDNDVCHHALVDPTTDDNRTDHYLTVKSQSIFCLEPAGDSPYRKSIADSISFGCIPVLFSDLTDDYAPWLWGDWKTRARVLVPREDYVAGRMDLQTLLQSIPLQLLRIYQRTLQENARKFQYSLDDDQEDGIRLLLDGLHRRAVRMEQSGTCGY